MNSYGRAWSNCCGKWMAARPEGFAAAVVRTVLWFYSLDLFPNKEWLKFFGAFSY